MPETQSQARKSALEKILYRGDANPKATAYRLGSAEAREPRGSRAFDSAIIEIDRMTHPQG
jgi:hypothetical protein